MTDEHAQELLEELTIHFKEPVMPVSRYCSAFRDWVSACFQETGERRNPLEGIDTFQLELAITKSNYLARRIYDGQPHRTERCPIHDGHWSGCTLAPCPEGCSSGFNLTGWLPEPHAYVQREEEDWMHHVRTDYEPMNSCEECGGEPGASVHNRSDSTVDTT